MVQVLRHCGYPFIFLVVLAESLGLPVPSFPFILIGAALAAELHFRLVGVVALSVLSALSGDSVWYLLGKRRGRSIFPAARKVAHFSAGLEATPIARREFGDCRFAL